MSELPTACDTGTKRDSQGFKHNWHGYKLHIDTVDGDIPVKAILTYLYDLADAAYCSPMLRAAPRALGHVPLIDHNPRRGEKIPFAPHGAQRFKIRSGAERVNARLKDSHGGTHVWVRGHTKIGSHLMFGIAVIAATQLLRLLQ